MTRIRASVTTTPTSPAPDKFCPRCDARLIYRQTVLNGIPLERWDYYECLKCGVLEYRHRTRKLRFTDMLPFRTE